MYLAHHELESVLIIVIIVTQRRHIPRSRRASHFEQRLNKRLDLCFDSKSASSWLKPPLQSFDLASTLGGATTCATTQLMQHVLQLLPLASWSILC